MDLLKFYITIISQPFALLLIRQFIVGMDNKFTGSSNVLTVATTLYYFFSLALFLISQIYIFISANNFSKSFNSLSVHGIKNSFQYFDQRGFIDKIRRKKRLHVLSCRLTFTPCCCVMVCTVSWEFSFKMIMPVLVLSHTDCSLGLLSCIINQRSSSDLKIYKIYDTRYNFFWPIFIINVSNSIFFAILFQSLVIAKKYNFD